MKRIITLAIMLSLIFTGCGNNNLSDNRDTNNIDISDYSDIEELLINGYTTSDKFDSDFKFNNMDKLDSISIKEYYIADKVIYLQVNNKYIYRFQLNDNDKIQSYIKYNLEA